MMPLGNAVFFLVSHSALLSSLPLLSHGSCLSAAAPFPSPSVSGFSISLMSLNLSSHLGPV